MRTPPLPFAHCLASRRASLVVRERRRSASTRAASTPLGRRLSMAAASASAHCEIASDKIHTQM